MLIKKLFEKIQTERRGFYSTLHGDPRNKPELIEDHGFTLQDLLVILTG